MSFQRWRPEPKTPIPQGALQSLYGQKSASVDQFFAAGGPLSKVFPGQYIPRPQQIGMAQQVARALQNQQILLAEAETGTGKSFACLVPAIFWALHYKKTVLVSTATLALQDQYCTKDLPMLQQAFSAMGKPFKWAKAQGRGNYFCRASKPFAEFSDEMDQVKEWLSRTITGDLNELPFDLKSLKYTRLVDLITAAAEDCPGRFKCLSGHNCYFYQAQALAARAHVVVVNHAILAANLRFNGQILPPFGALIVDECHQLDRYIRAAFEHTVQPGRLDKLAKKVASRGYDGADVLGAVANELNAHLRAYAASSSDNTLEFYSSSWKGSPAWLESVKHRLEPVWQGLAETGQADELAEAVLDAYEGIKRVTAEDQWARWVQRENGQTQIKIAPVDVSEYLKRLYPKSTILTSATLTRSGDYSFARAELGCEGNPSCIEMPPVHSPFDWSGRCLYIYPDAKSIVEADLKKKKGESDRQLARRWATRIAAPIKWLLDRSMGRAFVLFTGKAVMEDAHDLVAPRLREFGWTCLLQGQYSKTETIARFKAGTCPVLFATSSFWEGVDVQGSQLSLVIIDKLPFPSPSPIESAKKAQYKFEGYNIPMCVRTLQQGVGRLLRAESDIGAVCILDPRTRKYEEQIMRHLPGDAVTALHDTGTRIDLAQFLGASPTTNDEEAA